MFFATDYYLVPRRFLDEVNTEALLARHDAIWSAANAFKPGLSPKERLTLITELAYITDILWDRLLQARLQTAPSPRRIFVSHSSRDKGFAVSLAVDLGNSGHYVWLDEWEIRVGESIPTKINQGIEQSDVLIVVLSEHAVASHWVEREWQAKYWQEVDSGRIMVIPVLHRPCTVPALLRSKKYADFSEDYSKGLEQLLFALGVSGPRVSANSLILNRVSPPKQRMQRSGRNKTDRSRRGP
jgi:hypothetical protein